MKAMGVVLVVIGLLSLLYGGFSWFQKDTVVDAGSLEMSSDSREALSFPALQRRTAPVAVARMLLAQALDLDVHRLTLRAALACEIKTRPRQTHGPTRLRRGADVLFPNKLDGTPFLRRAYHFFAFTSLRIWICTAWSATNPLSRPFSSSSDRRRRASLTSRPPYFFFQP